MTNGKLLIGWAKTDITPRQPVNLQGQFHARITDKVLDPLTMTSLVVESGESTVVFLSADTGFIPPKVIKAVHAAVKNSVPEIQPSDILINATHTHTAPVLEDGFYPLESPEMMSGEAYADFFVACAAQTITEAWSKRAPGKAAWGLGHAVVGRNRRVVYFDDLSKRPGAKNAPGRCTVRNAAMYGATNHPMFSHIEGYEDHSVDLLYTWNNQDELTGVLINLACPSQEIESRSVISADFWHNVRVLAVEKLGPRVHILPQCSSAGDQSPHNIWYKDAEKRMWELRGLDSREEIARRILNTVTDVLPLVKKDAREHLILRTASHEIKLPRRLITDAEAEMARAGILEVEAKKIPPDADAALILRHKSICQSEIARCRLVLARYEKQTQEPELQIFTNIFRLGDVAFVSVPFEIFLDYGIRIKARSPALQTFVVQLANSCVGWDGNYVPTARAQEGESYSANFYCNSIGNEGGQVLVEALLAGLESLF